MSGLSIAFAVVGCALFGVALLFIFGLFAIGLGWAKGADVTADHALGANNAIPPRRARHRLGLARGRQS
jgi:hypothetical protein